MNEQFLRNEMLWGREGQQRLTAAHVIVFGLGGVGSYAAECLARSGVGELTLVDSDTISVTNLNRQLEALWSTVGQPKAAAAAARYDYIVDAIDLVSCKLDLAETARRLDIPLIMALGTGNKLDPTLLRAADISETYGCPLARVMRKELRNRGILHQRVVFSPEQAAPSRQLEAPPPGRRSVPASNPWLPAAAGLLLGSVVVRDILNQKERESIC